MRRRGVPKFPQDQVCGTGVQEEEHGLPDTIMSTQGSLSEMMVVGSKKSLGPFSCPWPGLEGRLEGSLYLMFPCHEVHGGNQLTKVPLDCTLDMVQGTHGD